jgi:hypothetical protein
MAGAAVVREIQVGSQKWPLVDELISAAIARMVADAIRDGAMLSASACAGQLVATFGRYGVNQDELADQVMMAAARAGVPVEVGRPRRPAEIAPSTAPRRLVLPTTGTTTH